MEEYNKRDTTTFLGTQPTFTYNTKEKHKSTPWSYPVIYVQKLKSNKTDEEKITGALKCLCMYKGVVKVTE